jgi:putative FmdB family regulatory protein
MPIYEYLCSKCDREFELMESIHEARLKAPCPNCSDISHRISSTIAIKMGPYIRPSKKVTPSSPAEETDSQT